MKYLDFYEKLGLSNKEDVFNYLIENFISSSKNYSYFVDWEKVKINILSIRIKLNLLNSLLSSKDLKADFRHLLDEYPEVIDCFPILLAVRARSIEVLRSYEPLSLDKFNFNDFSSTIEEYFIFFQNSGLYSLFESKQIKNLEDYVFGVEVGLDSHARKNRSGKSMEELTEFFIKKVVSENNDLEYLIQANSLKIKNKWNVNVEYDKSSKRFDFAVYNKITKKLFVIETNFFNTQGSKPSEVTRSYRTVFNEIKSQDIIFIWITDGAGWGNDKNHLQETFNYIDYLFSIKMLQEGILKDLFKK